MKKHATTVKVAASATQYVFKVSLKGDPGIWRTLALRGDQTLDHLHEAIFEAFDRFDPHLYSFYIRPPSKPPKTSKASNAVKSLKPTARGERSKPRICEYTSPDGCHGEHPWEEGVIIRNARRVRLGSLGLRLRKKFEYLFDFGDSWRHEITVEAIQPADETSTYPRIIEIKGKSPPQYDYSGDDFEIEVADGK